MQNKVIFLQNVIRIFVKNEGRRPEKGVIPFVYVLFPYLTHPATRDLIAAELNKGVAL